MAVNYIIVHTSHHKNGTVQHESVFLQSINYEFHVNSNISKPGNIALYYVEGIIDDGIELYIAYDGADFSTLVATAFPKGFGR